MNRLTRMLTYWLTGILMLCGLFASAVSEAANDPVVIRVGEVTFPLSVVQFALDPYVDLAEANGEELTEEDWQEIVDQIMDRLIGIGVIENKLIETGHYDFTDDEMDILRASAGDQYESVWQQVYRQLQSTDPNVEEETITSWMNKRGYTQEAFLRELIVNERESRIIDLYCSDVTVTEEEAEKYYRETFLEPDKKKYRDDVPQYENDVFLNGIQAYYTPEGYRYIKNILLAFPDVIASELEAIQVTGNKKVNAVQKAYDKLAAAAAAGEDTAPLKENYDRKIAALREQEDLYLKKAQEAIPLLQETIRSIRTQLDAGISIETLLKEYSLDQQQTGNDKPGALYHPDSQIWPDEAKTVINAMKFPGELSQPYADEKGVHLFWYAGDAPGGERVLTAEEKEQLRSSALYAAQTEKLNGLIDVWKQDYEITADPSLLQFE